MRGYPRTLEPNAAVLLDMRSTFLTEGRERPVRLCGSRNYQKGAQGRWALACLLGGATVVGVFVEARAGLLAGQSGFDHTQEQRRSGVQRLLELFVHGVGDGLD